MIDAAQVQREVQARLRSHRGRLPPQLWSAFDSLLARRGFLGDDRAALFHPLGQPIAAFPLWVADAVDDGDESRRLDVVEASVVGYLYVRVHDDRLDEQLGDPDHALFLADSFLIRHQALLARHVGTSDRFWTFFEQVAARYAAAMLLERELLRADAVYDADEFDRILQRSHPLVLPGAALLDVADRWELLEALRRFVHHAVRAAQLVDDLLDSETDRAAGRCTWVVRRLGGEAGSEEMALRLVRGGIDEIVADVLIDIDAADVAAREIGMTAAVEWLAMRRAEVTRLRKVLVTRALLG